MPRIYKELKEIKKKNQGGVGRTQFEKQATDLSREFSKEAAKMTTKMKNKSAQIINN